MELLNNRSVCVETMHAVTRNRCLSHCMHLNRYAWMQVWHFAGYELKMLWGKKRWIICALAFLQAAGHLSHTLFSTWRQSKSTWHWIWNTALSIQLVSYLRKMPFKKKVWLEESFFFFSQTTTTDQKPPNVKLFVYFSDSMDMRENISSPPGSIMLKCTLMLFHVKMHSDAGRGGRQSWAD